MLNFLFFVVVVFLEGAFGLPDVTQESGSLREDPELNTVCCSTCKRPYEQSTNEEQIAKRVKHDEVHSVCSTPTVSEDKFSYMGEVFDNSFCSFHLFTVTSNKYNY